MCFQIAHPSVSPASSSSSARWAATSVASAPWRFYQNVGGTQDIEIVDHVGDRTAAQ